MENPENSCWIGFKMEIFFSPLSFSSITFLCVLLLLLSPVVCENCVTHSEHGKNKNKLKTALRDDDEEEDDDRSGGILFPSH